MLNRYCQSYRRLSNFTFGEMPEMCSLYVLLFLVLLNLNAKYFGEFGHLLLGIIESGQDGLLRTGAVDGGDLGLEVFGDGDDGGFLVLSHGSDIVAGVDDRFSTWEGHSGDAADLLVDVGIDLARLAEVLIEGVEGVDGGGDGGGSFAKVNTLCLLSEQENKEREEKDKMG